MHEVAPITATATALVEATAGESVGAVTVAIAPDVDPDVAAVSWQAAVDDTPLATAAITWQPARHTLSCLDCTTDYEGDELDTCPRCGGNGLIVVRAPICAVVDWTPAGTPAAPD